MVLEVIYVTRHGFRSSWSVNHRTGEYTAALLSPTGIPSDPELTSHGVDQAKELGIRLRGVDPPIERVYSSPYYRCLQTIEPFVTLSNKGSSGQDGDSSQGGEGKGEREGKQKQKQFTIRAEAGVAEWYGAAHFEHPTSAAPEVLKSHFEAVDLSYQPFTHPSRMGESLAELHNRVAATMHEIISQCDRDGVRAVVICTHAAVVIAMGRVLTGKMPENVEEEDFRAFTAGLSVYHRRTVAGSGAEGEDKNKTTLERASVDPGAARESRGTIGVQPQPPSSALPTSRATSELLIPAWKGCGVAGGWECIANSDCSHLTAGEERGWRFSGDEAFAISAQKGEGEGFDAGMGLGVVVEGKASRSTGTSSRL